MYVRKRMEVAEKEHGERPIAFGLTDAFWTSLGVPDNKRSHASRLLRACLPPGAAFKYQYPLPKTATPRFSWFAMKQEVFDEMRERARLGDPDALHRQLLDRHKDAKADAEKQQNLFDGGELRCPTCTVPLFDPRDADYAKKMEHIEKLADGPLPPTCICPPCA